MTDDKSSLWPTIRVNPASKNRLKAILEKAGDRTSLVMRFNDLLSDTLDQIEAAEPLMSPTVLQLRTALGQAVRIPPGAFDMDRIVQRLQHLEQRVLAPDFDLATAAETTQTPPIPTERKSVTYPRPPRRKKSA